MQSHGKVWITYSANTSDGSYAMGLLSAPSSANLLDAASWTKSSTPVFTSSAASSVFGPGSNSFTVSDDGRDVVDVYNARSYGPVADPLTDRNRAIRMQKVSWRPDGTPDFGTPAPDGPTDRIARPGRSAGEGLGAAGEDGLAQCPYRGELGGAWGCSSARGRSGPARAAGAAARGP